MQRNNNNNNDKNRNPESGSNPLGTKQPRTPPIDRREDEANEEKRQKLVKNIHNTPSIIFDFRSIAPDLDVLINPTSFSYGSGSQLVDDSHNASLENLHRATRFDEFTRLEERVSPTGLEKRVSPTRPNRQPSPLNPVFLPQRRGAIFIPHEDLANNQQALNFEFLSNKCKEILQNQNEVRRRSRDDSTIAVSDLEKMKRDEVPEDKKLIASRSADHVFEEKTVEQPEDRFSQFEQHLLTLGYESCIHRRLTSDKLLEQGAQAKSDGIATLLNAKTGGILTSSRLFGKEGKLYALGTRRTVRATKVPTRDEVENALIKIPDNVHIYVVVLVQDKFSGEYRLQMRVSLGISSGHHELFLDGEGDGKEIVVAAGEIHTKGGTVFLFNNKSGRFHATTAKHGYDQKAIVDSYLAPYYHELFLENCFVHAIKDEDQKMYDEIGRRKNLLMNCNNNSASVISTSTTTPMDIDPSIYTNNNNSVLFQPKAETQPEDNQPKVTDDDKPNPSPTL